jgi:hypothetical protein
MRIIRFSAQNFARLNAIEIEPTPDGSIVALRGKNTQGKSSVLKGIWAAFVGRAVAPPRAIRDGTDEARLRVDVGTVDHTDLIIERTIKRDKHGGETWGLKVTQSAGSVARKPQELIDASLAALAFDPLAFARAAPKEQLAQLKALIPGVDFAEIGERRAECFDERTSANRDAKAAAARASGVVLPPGPEPDPVHTTELVAKMDEAATFNANRARLVSHHAATLRERDRHRENATLLHIQADKAAALAEELDERVALIEIPEAIDTAQFTEKIATAQLIEATRRKFELRRTYESDAEQAKALSTKLTATIEALDTTVHNAIAAAKLPAGLTLTADGVFLRGLPFEQASDSEKVIASAGVCMALSPDLRVMLIDRAESLDQSSMVALARLAESHDYQIWTAEVDDGDGASGFYIEDGRLARKETAK